MVKVKCKQCGKEFEVTPSRIKEGGGKFCSNECKYRWKSENMKGDKSPLWKGIKKKCPICSKEFFTSPSEIKEGRGKFCSRKCRGISQTKKVKRICKMCGKEFLTYSYLIKKGYGKFCSRDCKGKWMSEHMRGNKHPRFNKIKKICEICRKEFMITPSKIQKDKGRFCSKDCANKWQSIYRRGENSPTWKGGGVKMNCVICGKEFISGVWEVKDGRKYCSQKCAKKGRVLFYKKENHYNWKGGITKIEERIRKNLKYSDWRLKVFERDKYTCQKCGQRGGRLHAHHIKPFSQILKELKEQYPLFDLYDMAMMYEPLWDVSNSITLCENCHKKIHKENKKR